MRVDKFLKLSRLIKRRSVAKEACDSGRIEINGKVAKAGAEVKIGDLLTIHLGKGPVFVKVLELAESSKKEEAQSMYEIVNGRIDERN